MEKCSGTVTFNPPRRGMLLPIRSGQAQRTLIAGAGLYLNIASTAANIAPSDRVAPYALTTSAATSSGCLFSGHFAGVFRG